MTIDKVDKAIKEEQILYDIAKDRYEKLGIKNCLRRMEEHKQYIELFEELKELREENETQKALHGGTEEQGLLLRLPCKVGDTVYAIGFNNNKPIIYESVVLSILITEKEIDFNVKVNEFEINSQLKQSMFGKTVFLTQEEAEQKLKEMESDNNGTMES